MSYLTSKTLTKRMILVLAIFLFGTGASAGHSSKRPAITGIDHVRLYVTDIEKSHEFYTKLIGVRPRGGMCPDSSPSCLTVGWEKHQTIELEKAPVSGAKNWVAEIAFTTNDVGRMRAYLVAHGVAAGKITEYKYANHAVYAHFEVRDPEGIPLSFVQRFIYPTDDPGPGDPSYAKILHAGFVVKDMAAENHFYRDLLGFRLYWRGGFQDDGVDWYEIQVPDGNNWIEYMLNIPAGADHKELGVQNHFSLGVVDIRAAAEELHKRGIENFDGPEIGRDGKWALDAYDPDGTRVELMEFAPVEKPCCSDYTGPHPRP